MTPVEMAIQVWISLLVQANKIIAVDIYKYDDDDFIVMAMIQDNAVKQHVKTGLMSRLMCSVSLLTLSLQHS